MLENESKSCLWSLKPLKIYISANVGSTTSRSISEATLSLELGLVTVWKHQVLLTFQGRLWLSDQGAGAVAWALEGHDSSTDSRCKLTIFSQRRLAS